MNEIYEKYKCYSSEDARHLESGTLDIVYMPWNHFDIISVWAHCPTNQLKSVELGYGFCRDYAVHYNSISKCSVSTEITKNIPKDGILITILSYNEALKLAKKIDWNNIKENR
jgi:hypothetical protein